MTTRIRTTLEISCSVFVLAAIILAVWQYLQPIRIPLRIDMTREDVRQALTTAPSHSYTFYSDPDWCSRDIIRFGELFSYHTWIGYTFDEQSRLTSVRGYHAITIELPVIGFHDLEFPQRDIILPTTQ